MNVNRLYLAEIYVYSSYEYDYERYTLFYNIKFYNKKAHSEFCKDAVVYRNRNNEYIDIKTGEKYKTALDYDSKIGDMFISFKNGLIPINELEEINFERKNMSKRKILKKLSNTSLYNKKEEDK